MLEELATKDKRWREVALNICKCKDLADEIVNRMYLKIYDLNPDKEKLTEWYIITTLRNLFIDCCKELRKRDDSLDDLLQSVTKYNGSAETSRTTDYSRLLKDEETDKSFSDDELELLMIANNELKWWEKQLLIESYDKSLRQIQKDFNINYQFVSRHTKKARAIVIEHKLKKNGKRSA